MTATDDIRMTAIPPEVTTPARVDTGIGVLEFADGYPDRARPRRSCVTTSTTCTASMRS